MQSQGESPDQFLIVKQRPGRTCGAGVHTQCAYESERGLHLADGTLFWVVFAVSERDLRRLRLPWVPRPACAFGAKSLKAVTDRVRSRSRDNFSRRAVTSYLESTGSRTRRDSIRVAFFAWLFRGSKAFQYLPEDAACAAGSNGAKNSMRR